MTTRRAVLFFSACIAATLFVPPLRGDNVRGPLAGTFSLSGRVAESGASTISLNLEDLAAVVPDGDMRFIQGVSIRIDVPESVQYYGDSFALYLYRRISPEPADGIRTYRGERLVFKPFAFMNRVEIQVPLRKQHTLVASPDITLIRETLTADDFPLLITILPVMKGIPQSLSRAQFPVTVRPLFADEGSLRLRAEIPEGIAPGLLTVKIDGKDVAYPAEEYLLPAGMHQLTVSSAAFQPVQLSFGIERGRTTELAVPLVPLRPELLIEAPADTVIFLDGARVEPSARKFAVSPGSHTVVFKLGDQQVSRRFDVEPGKLYKISLFLDISIQER